MGASRQGHNTERTQRLREIEKLDPERDFHKIWVLDFLYEFPWDLDIGQWLAFYSTLTSPDDAKLLVRTGDMVEHTQRRLDHMATLMWEMSRNGFADARGKAAARQMNRIHKNSVKHLNSTGGQWDISNDQYMFVLAATLVVPQRWLDRYGWRPVSPKERRAAVNFYRAFGQHMGLKDIPETYEEFERFFDAYEKTHVVHSPEARQLWEATRGKLVERLTIWLPPVLRRRCEPLAERMLPVLLSDAQRRAFGIPAPSSLWRTAVHTGFKARARYVRNSRPRTEPAATDRLPTRTFPTADYEITEVGPDHSVRQAAPVAASWTATKAGTPLSEQLAGLHGAEREHRLVELVRTEAAAALGLKSVGAVPRTQPFTALGFDSLATVKLRDRLNKATGLRLPATALFDYPTPEALARRLGDLLADNPAPPAPVAATGDLEEQRVRRALAEVPLDRLREAGLLETLLSLAEPAHDATAHPQKATESTAVPEAAPTRKGTGTAPDAADEAIDGLDADDLIRMALDNPES